MGEGGPPRRRSALDNIPQNVEPKFKVLGPGLDRQVVQAQAKPMEMVVIHGYTREIEDAFQKFHGRSDAFWENHPKLIDTARKLDEIFAGILARKSGS
jgi:hypothetical protein